MRKVFNAILIYFYCFNIWAIDITSNESFLFDFDDTDDGGLTNGSRDSYDSCYLFSVNGTEYRANKVSGKMILNNRGVQMTQIKIGDLDVTRQGFVPANDGNYGRYLDSITNSGADSVDVSVVYKCELGSDASTKVYATSDGDTDAEATDMWIGTDDTDGSGDPSLTHILQGNYPTVPISSIVFNSQSPDQFEVTYTTFALAPGETVRFMIFAVQEDSRALAQETAQYLVSSDIGYPPAAAVEGLTLEELSQIVNWFNDTDNDGDSYSTQQGDCNDHNIDINPNNEEVCDLADNNCNYEIDEGFNLNTYYIDSDNDNHGDPELFVEACMLPDGYTDVPGDDCDDSNPNINPDIEEICDEIDNNCNDETDEDFGTQIFYRDLDQDNFGDSSTFKETCYEIIEGYVSDNTDCDDNNNAINPEADEVCDGVDNNCNNETDEGFTEDYYPDNDGDGYGNTVGKINTCSPPENYVKISGDCNDMNYSINPEAVEICDNKDNNCNNETDENCTQQDAGVDIIGDVVNDNENTDIEEDIALDLTEDADGDADADADADADTDTDTDTDTDADIEVDGGTDDSNNGCGCRIAYNTSRISYFNIIISFLISLIN